MSHEGYGLKKSLTDEMRRLHYLKYKELITEQTHWSVKAAVRIATETSHIAAEPYISQIARIIREEHPESATLETPEQ